MIAIGGTEMESALPHIEAAMAEIQEEARRPWSDLVDAADVVETLSCLGVEARLIPRLLRLPPAPGAFVVRWPEEFVTFSLRSGLPLESLLDQVEARNGG